MFFQVLAASSTPVHRLSTIGQDYVKIDKANIFAERLALKIRSGRTSMGIADFLRSRLLYLDVRRSIHR
jgi:hypothetical protein